jgi:hypothetical protein
MTREYRGKFYRWIGAVIYPALFCISGHFSLWGSLVVAAAWAVVIAWHEETGDDHAK